MTSRNVSQKGKITLGKTGSPDAIVIAGTSRPGQIEDNAKALSFN